MLVRKFLFPRDKRIKNIILIFLLFFIISILSSCGEEKIWDIPLKNFKSRLENGNYSFLQHINYEDVDFDEVEKLGKNSPLYLFYIFDHLKLENPANKMVDLELKDGNGIWRDRAGIVILNRLLKKGVYSSVIEIADSLLKDRRVTVKCNGDCEDVRLMFSDDFVRIVRAKIEALYWLKRDREVVDLINRYKEKKNGCGLNLESDTELNLFLAVSSYRLSDERWRAMFRRLFFDFKSSFVHSRGYAFLKRDDKRLNSFNSFELSIFEFKDFLGRGLQREAVSLCEVIVTKYPVEVSKYSPLIIKELGDLYLLRREYTRGVKFLTKASKNLSGRARLDSLEMLGRIYRKARNYGSALFFLREVADNTLNVIQRDRSIWFVIDILLRRSVKDALEYVKKTYLLWSDYGYFEDVLNDITSKLVISKRWQDIYQLYELLRDRGPDGVNERLISILKGLIRKGEFSLNSTALSLLNEDVERVLRDSPNSYYGLVLGYMSGKLQVVGDVDGDVDSGSKRVITGRDIPFRYVAGFFDFGLGLKGYMNAIERRNYLSPNELLQIAELLNNRGFFRQSINITRLYIGRVDKALYNCRVRSLYYPRVYLGAIGDSAQKYGIDEFVILSLIREESHFDAKIVSRAGAVGLTQMLPITARDVARKLRITNPELTDPVVNIELGVKHLSDLYKRLNSMVKALIAYNAGLARLRGWERRFGELDDFLFIEALPFGETREYVEKIVLSSVYYSSNNPKDVVQYYFGDL